MKVLVDGVDGVLRAEVKVDGVINQRGIVRETRAVVHGVEAK